MCPKTFPQKKLNFSDSTFVLEIMPIIDSLNKKVGWMKILYHNKILVHMIVFPEQTYIAQWLISQMGHTGIFCISFARIILANQRLNKLGLSWA